MDLIAVANTKNNLKKKIVLVLAILHETQLFWKPVIELLRGSLLFI